MRNIKARCEQFETQIDYQRAYMSTQDSSHSTLKKKYKFHTNTTYSMVYDTNTSAY